MKHLAWAFIILLLSSSGVAAPQYRAGQSSSSLYGWLHGEVSADYQFSSQKMELTNQDLATSTLHGMGLRALWAPLTWLSVGVEMGRFGKKSMPEAFVSSYKTNRMGAVIKFTLSPDTAPRIYALAGFGKTFHQIEYDHSSVITATWPGQEKKNIRYWMAGLGLETDVWKDVFVGIEGNVLRHQTTQLMRYYQTNSKTETMLRLRAGVHF